MIRARVWEIGIYGVKCMDEDKGRRGFSKRTQGEVG